MPSRTVRRLLTGLAAAGVAALGLAAPAHADPTAPSVTMPGTVVGQGSAARFSASFFDGTASYTNPKITFDTSGLIAGVTVAFDPQSGPNRCSTTSPTMLTCTPHVDTAGHVNITVRVVAGKTAKAGHGGTVQATFAAEGAAPATGTATVEVAEGIGLKGGSQPEAVVHPGDRFDVNLAITNNSNSTVHGLVLAAPTELVNTYDMAVSFTERFSNCTYADNSTYKSSVVMCHFDIDLKPGVTARAVMPAVLREETEVPSAGFRTYLSWQWLTSDTLKYDRSLMLHSQGPDVQPGTGPVLSLQPAGAPVTEGAVKQFGKSGQLLRVHVIPAGATTGTGGGSGDDPTLPITGPRTGLIAGAGALVVALGVLGLVLARRRTRFEA